MEQIDFSFLFLHFLTLPTINCINCTIYNLLSLIIIFCWGESSSSQLTFQTPFCYQIAKIWGNVCILLQNVLNFRNKCLSNSVDHGQVVMHLAWTKHHFLHCTSQPVPLFPVSVDEKKDKKIRK